jgi:hypothetical protein
MLNKHPLRLCGRLRIAPATLIITPVSYYLGAKVRESGSNSKCATICLAVAADGTKLPPFVVFKGTFASPFSQ